MRINTIADLTAAATRPGVKSVTIVEDYDQPGKVTMYVRTRRRTLGIFNRRRKRELEELILANVPVHVDLEIKVYTWQI